MPEAQLFHDVVRVRKSMRSYLADPVPDALLQALLDDLEFFGTPYLRPLSSKAANFLNRL
jgi:hypothetical protein